MIDDNQRFDVEQFVEWAPWRIAKFMPHLPHEYIVRDQVPDLHFDAFVALIDKEGYSERWGRYTHRYLEVAGWKYWAMPGRGDPPGTIRIINRERHSCGSRVDW